MRGRGMRPLMRSSRMPAAPSPGRPGGRKKASNRRAACPLPQLSGRGIFGKSRLPNLAASGRGIFRKPPSRETYYVFASGPVVAAMIAVCAALAFVATAHAAGRPQGAGRIFVLMVWDGLRPDLVTHRDTPNAFAFQNEGVRFNNHHSLFPTVTMVNAATLATGAPPGGSGIYDDLMYFLPLLGKTLASDPSLANEINGPIDIERSPALIALNSPRGFDGRLLGLASVAQPVERAGGFIATVGKTGPTFMFDDRVGDQQSGTPAGANNIFVSDDLAETAADIREIGPPPGMRHGHPPSAGQRRAWFTNPGINKPLPASNAASNE